MMELYRVMFFLMLVENMAIAISCQMQEFNQIKSFKSCLHACDCDPLDLILHEAPV